MEAAYHPGALASAAHSPQGCAPALVLSQTRAAATVPPAGWCRFESRLRDQNHVAGRGDCCRWVRPQQGKSVLLRAAFGSGRLSPAPVGRATDRVSSRAARCRSDGYPAGLSATERRCTAATGNARAADIGRDAGPARRLLSALPHRRRCRAGRVRRGRADHALPAGAVVCRWRSVRYFSLK